MANIPRKGLYSEQTLWHALTLCRWNVNLERETFKGDPQRQILTM